MVLVMSDEKRPSASDNFQSTIQLTINDSEKSLSWVQEFEFQLSVPTDPEKRPYIYFNNDLSLMMVQYQNDFSADIYMKTESSKKITAKKSNFVTWKIREHIHRYPIMLKHKSYTNFLFSPSFARYIDIDYSTQ